jgi:hypothetical protein
MSTSRVAGTNGISDAQLRYGVSLLANPNVSLPASAEVFRGKKLDFGGNQFEVTTLTRASYKGMEGELPFPYYGKSEMLFADLRTPGPAFATLDYSDDPPLLFVGEWIEFEELKLKNLRQFEGWA